ncbi:MAG: ATP-binding protein [Candidatus Methylomirabilales bacterium]
MTGRGVPENLARIRAFVLLRYTLIIAVAYLLLVEHKFPSPPSGLILLIVAALTSNLLMTRLPTRITNSPVFNASIIVGDTVWVTAALLYSGLFGAEFFYLYFFILLLAAIGENLGLIVVGTVVVCIASAFLLSASGAAPSLWSSPSLIRIPFLFTAAVFYGYLVDRVRREQQRARAESDAVTRLEDTQRKLAERALELERINKELEHEISERHRAEEALQAAKNYAQNLINSSMDMIISVDMNRNIVEFNPAAEQTFGCSKGEVLGKPVDLLYADPSEGLRVNTQVSKYGVLGGEITSKRKNGETFCSYLTASVMRDSDGEVLGMMGISRDITEHKRAEEELKATQLQLIQSAKLESVGRLAAGVAHEVKNPLAIIQQGLAYLSHDFLTTDGDNVAPVLEKMDNAVRRADRVIRGLLDFSAPSEVDVTPAGLNVLVEESLLLVEHELARAHVSVVKELGENLPLLKLDRQKMEQVFVNLFMNAVQAMPEGGTLTVKTDARHLRELGPNPFRNGKTIVVVEVEDTGTGIPDDKLDRVFDPFFTTKPTGQGTGLGLTVTRKIIELHGGMIHIRNRHDGGVGVTIAFETERGEEDAEEADPAH